MHKILVHRYEKLQSLIRVAQCVLNHADKIDSAERLPEVSNASVLTMGISHRTTTSHASLGLGYDAAKSIGEIHDVTEASASNRTGLGKASRRTAATSENIT